MLEFFYGLTIIQQLFVLFCLSIVIILSFTIFFKNKELGIRHFVDPGSLSEANTRSHFIIALIETIAGIVIIGILVSLLTSQLIEVNKKRKLQVNHTILKEAFQTNILIRTRNLLKENNLTAEQRRLYVKSAEVKLEIGREDIIETIRLNGNLRLRMLKTNHKVVIENFNANKTYGEYIDRNSNITIIATQNYSDAGIGHFAKTIANNLGANYISNEYFSTGSPLQNNRINFASNPKYLTMDDKGKTVLDKFIKDIKKLNDKTKLFVYLGTSNHKREHDLHIMFGGEKKSKFNTIAPTYANIQKLKKEYDLLSSQIKKLNLRTATHEEFGNKTKKNLNNSLHSNFNKDSLKIYISTKILWSEDEKQYYLVMISLMDMIKKLS